MMEPLPLACSLGSGDLARRLEEWRRVGRFLRHSHFARGTAVWHFEAEAATELKRLIEAESRCCAFFDFDLELTDEAIQVELSAPEGADSLVRELHEVVSAPRR